MFISRVYVYMYVYMYLPEYIDLFGFKREGEQGLAEKQRQTEGVRVSISGSE